MTPKTNHIHAFQPCGFTPINDPPAPHGVVPFTGTQISASTKLMTPRVRASHSSKAVANYLGIDNGQRNGPTKRATKHPLARDSTTRTTRHVKGQPILSEIARAPEFKPAFSFYNESTAMKIENASDPRTSTTDGHSTLTQQTYSLHEVPPNASNTRFIESRMYVRNSHLMSDLLDDEADVMDSLTFLPPDVQIKDFAGDTVSHDSSMTLSDANSNNSDFMLELTDEDLKIAADSSESTEMTSSTENHVRLANSQTSDLDLELLAEEPLELSSSDEWSVSDEEMDAEMMLFATAVEKGTRC